MGYNAIKWKEHRMRGIKENSGSAKLTELLRELVFDRILQQESFVHYISALRMDKAKELLLKENHTVAFVGNQIGYSNQRYFMKWFKETTGWTPGEFRRLHGR